MSKKIALVGFDLEVLELLETIESKKIVGYIDKNNLNTKELKYLGSDKDFIKNTYSDIEVVLSMDIPKVRAKLFNFYKDYISKFISHRTSNISKRSKIGHGTLIQSNVLVSAMVKIGNGCFLNHSSAIHHESEIGDFTILAPKSLVLGRVKIGNQCYIGAGAIIKEDTVIGSNVIIGAGSVVLNDIPDNSVVVGNPAKKYLGKN